MVTGEERDISTVTYVWEKVRDEMDPATASVSGTQLTISPLVVGDRGLYVCTVTSWCGTVARSSAVLEVEPREPPSVELYPAPHQAVPSGGSVMLQCRYRIKPECHDTDMTLIRTMTGIPQPTVTWSREDGRPLTESTEILEGGVLRIIGVREEEAGAYVCRAENVVGVASTTASIQIEKSEENVWRQRPGHSRLPYDLNSYPEETTAGYNVYDRNHPSEENRAEASNIQPPHITRPRHSSDNISVITNAGSDVDLNCVAYPHITRPASRHQHGDVVWSRTDGRGIDPRHRVEGGENLHYTFKNDDGEIARIATYCGGETG